MPLAEDWLAHFYPYLLDEADPRYVPHTTLHLDLTVAFDWRPACLSEDRQNQAQAHFAAYLAAFRRAVEAESGSASGSTTEVVAGPLIELTEGDLTKRWATSGGTTTTASTSTLRANLTGPNTPYALWHALWLLCAGAGDVLEPGQLPIRRGAIMTSAG